MQESKTLMVDGKKYVTTMFSPTIGFPLAAKLAKYLFPVCGEIGKQASPGVDDDFRAIGEALFSSMPIDDVVPTLLELFSTTQTQTEKMIRPIVFDNDFRGEYMHALKLASEIVAFQFSDFMSAIRSMLAGNRQVADDKSNGKTGTA